MRRVLALALLIAQGCGGGSGPTATPAAGHASCTDERNPDLLAEADLLGAVVTSHDGDLQVTWHVAAAIDGDGAVAEDHTRAFYVNGRGDGHGYQLGVKWVGSEFFQFTFDMDDSQNTYLDTALKIRGTEVTATFDGAADDLGDTFDWDVASTFDGRDIDRCPADPNMAKQQPFPDQE